MVRLAILNRGKTTQINSSDFADDDDNASIGLPLSPEIIEKRKIMAKNL